MITRTMPPMPSSQASRSKTNCSTKDVAQRRADAGHVARHRAHGDRPADAERRRRTDRDGDHEADGGALDGERDRIEGEARDVHCVAIAFPP
jgi:hypothetical protein